MVSLGLQSVNTFSQVFHIFPRICHFTLHTCPTQRCERGIWEPALCWLLLLYDNLSALQ